MPTARVRSSGRILRGAHFFLWFAVSACGASAGSSSIEQAEVVVDPPVHAETGTAPEVSDDACTSCEIPHASTASCESGECLVQTCEVGYEPGADHRVCDIARFAMPSVMLRADSSRFGFSVDISGDGQTIAAGAPGGDVPGQVRTFLRTSHGWDPGPSILDRRDSALGFDVALSADGQLLAAMDPESSSVRVYNLSGGRWRADPRLGLPQGSLLAGGSLDVSGDGGTVLIGDPHDGQIWYFLNDSHRWERGIYRPSSADTFGSSVAVSDEGHVAVVGDEMAHDARARVLVDPALEPVIAAMSDAEEDVSRDTLLLTPPGVSGHGNAVAISGTAEFAVVSSSGGQGGVSVYDLRSTARTMVALVPPGHSRSFGRSLAIDQQGATIVVGDPRGGTAHTGQVSIYQRQLEGWTLLRVLPVPSEARAFGFDVGISSDGSIVVVGDPTASPEERGAVWVYQSEYPDVPES